MTKSASKKISVVPYDKNWPEIYKLVSGDIIEILGDHCHDIHHIGSTSVPRLAAKPELDILCIVDQLESSLQLEQHGFEFRGEFNIPLRYFFSDNLGEMNINLHVVEEEHGFIELNLTFRDYLRANIEARDQYADLKAELAKQEGASERVAGHFRSYNLGKNTFIKDVLKKSGYDGLMVNFCLHEKEISQFNKILKNSGANYVVQDFFGGPEKNFVLYKGTQVVAIAKVEIDKRQAFLRFIETDGDVSEYYREYLLNTIRNWVIHHKLFLVL